MVKERKNRRQGMKDATVSEAGIGSAANGGHNRLAAFFRLVNRTLCSRPFSANVAVGVASLGVAIWIPIAVLLIDESHLSFRIDRGVIIENVLRMPFFVPVVALVFIFVVVFEIVKMALRGRSSRMIHLWTAVYNVAMTALLITMAILLALVSFSAVSWVGDTDYYSGNLGNNLSHSVNPEEQESELIVADMRRIRESMSYRYSERYEYLREKTLGGDSCIVWSSFFSEKDLDHDVIRYMAYYYLRVVLQESTEESCYVGVLTDNLGNIHQQSSEDFDVAYAIIEEYIKHIEDDNGSLSYSSWSKFGLALVKLVLSTDKPPEPKYSALSLGDTWRIAFKNRITSHINRYGAGSDTDNKTRRLVTHLELVAEYLGVDLDDIYDL